ncbi:MAG: alanine racemase domain protein [Firmicutes bacterium]|nr:alanine racemase domain protein [Bacillota bacterium]MDI6706211.1 ornithine racemase Orr [Bacillota bacterium]
MSSFPRVEVSLSKLEHNAKRVVEVCKPLGIEVAAVTKGFCAYPELAEALLRGGVQMLADSRIDNLKKLQHFSVPKILLRIPMISELDDVLEYSDYVLISEIETAKILGQKAAQRGKKHKVIIMVDLGDLREGFWLDDVVEAAGKINGMDGIELAGIGTNLSCYGGVIPSEANLGNLAGFARRIEEELGINLSIVSGGNSSSMPLVFDGKIPSKINNLRIGEAMLLGRETITGIERENFYNDTFVLEAEIVEIKEKPSVPIGEIGVDAFGKIPVFEDRGIRKRAIIAVGKQDLQPDTLIPADKSIIILGGSSDHTLLDIHDCRIDYKVGDVLRFELTYGGMLWSMTSPYVKKVFIP